MVVDISNGVLVWTMLKILGGYFGDTWRMFSSRYLLTVGSHKRFAVSVNGLKA